MSCVDGGVCTFMEVRKYRPRNPVAVLILWGPNSYDLHTEGYQHEKDNIHNILYNNSFLIKQQKPPHNTLKLINKKNFTVMYSGTENPTGQYGTGFIISRKITESILEC